MNGTNEPVENSMLLTSIKINNTDTKSS